MMDWHIHKGDCIPHMLEEMEPKSVDFAVFSPPFPSLYAYTSEACDIGNTDTMGPEAEVHLAYFYRGLARVLKPGRVAMVHVCQIPRMKRSGGVGLCDFRGINIRIGERAGLIYEYDWLVRKNPQAQAIRTRSRELQFSGLENDRAKQRGTLCDYLIKFTAPGDNAVPIRDWEVDVDDDGEVVDKRQVHETQVSRNQWIDWAEGAWMDIRETDTLNTKEAKGEDDTKHICLARDSMVLTKERGYVPIQDVQIGEHALTHMGRWRPIIAKKKTADSARVVRVRAQGVFGLTLTPTHKVWARGTNGKPSRSRKDRAKNCSPNWTEAGSLGGSFVNLKLPPVEDNDTSDDVWWIVGRWIADGHVDKRNCMHISAGDAKIDELRKRLGNRSGSEHKTTATQVLVRDPDHMIRDIVDRCGRGAANKKLPPEAFTLSESKAKSLLDGYLSGDGHYNANRKRWTISTASRELAIGLQILIQRAYGSIATLHRGRGERKHIIEGREVNAKTEWVVTFNECGYTFGFMESDGAWKPVSEVSDAGESETWNISVEEDASYTAEGCIVKNCPLQLEVIRRLAKLYSNPGELVFSPFTGVGSEGVVSLQLGRRFHGCEIKDEYHRTACKNLSLVVNESVSQKSLFEGDDEC